MPGPLTGTVRIGDYRPAIARALLIGLVAPERAVAGLAPLVMETVMGTVRELKREHVSMLLVEQNAERRWGSRTAST